MPEEMQDQGACNSSSSSSSRRSLHVAGLQSDKSGANQLAWIVGKVLRYRELHPQQSVELLSLRLTHDLTSQAMPVWGSNRWT